MSSFGEEYLRPPDTVIPLHYEDDQAVNRSTNMTFTMRFDDVLDVGNLHSALLRLLEIGNWRKLGARLRKGVGFNINTLFINTILRVSRGHAVT
jgi:hypothetical protein